mmetsp:Transcript_32884/g.51297  ORF Transcript_32884/g.51297 Transcript_32884/m.51297 type:complete len:146 (-) Transcript_32884:154-591(-)
MYAAWTVHYYPRVVAKMFSDSKCESTYDNNPRVQEECCRLQINDRDTMMGLCKPFLFPLPKAKKEGTGRVSCNYSGCEDRRNCKRIHVMCLVCKDIFCVDDSKIGDVLIKHAQKSHVFLPDSRFVGVLILFKLSDSKSSDWRPSS